MRRGGGEMIDREMVNKGKESSDEDVSRAALPSVEDLEESGADDDKKEESEYNGSDGDFILFFLRGKRGTPDFFLSRLSAWCLSLLSFISWSFA